MARFPKVPGAGAKSIGNPVYWSRMAIQNDRYRAQSEAAAIRAEERYKRLWLIYDDIWDDKIERLIEESETSSKDVEKGNQLNEEFLQCDKSLTVPLTQQQLNKLATRLKNFAIEILQQCHKYEIYSNLSDIRYDSKRRVITCNEEDFYYLG